MTLEDVFVRRTEDLDRLRRNGVEVCEDSTPVLFFGDIEDARTLTVGINPSWQEFLCPNGEVLPPGQRRFAHESDLRAAARPAEQALELMRSYFRLNPYERWFARVERLVNAFGHSLWTGTAAHTDIGSCFATNPSWSGLSGAAQAAVSATGYETFQEVIANARRLELIIIIGATARHAMSDSAAVGFRDLPSSLDATPKFRRWNNPILCVAEWPVHGGVIPVLAIKPYLNGTPFAPLTNGEIDEIPMLLDEDHRKRAAS